MKISIDQINDVLNVLPRKWTMFTSGVLCCAFAFAQWPELHAIVCGQIVKLGLGVAGTIVAIKSMLDSVKRDKRIKIEMSGHAALPSTRIPPENIVLPK